VKLPESEKEKDRDLIRGIPEILAIAEYAIVKASSFKEKEKSGQLIL